MSTILKNETDFVGAMVQKSLAFVGPEDMKKIQETTIAQAGFGGIGAFILELLARWGIKKFKLLDMDRYEPTNMNRQVFATVGSLDKPKAEVAAARLLEINPYAKVEKIYHERLSKENVEDFISGASVIINGIDFPSGQLPLHYYAKKSRIPVINPHCMNVTAATLEVFDYRLPGQQSIDSPTKSRFLNGIMHKYLNLFKFDENSLSDESLAKADERFKGKRGPTLNFVTNLAACLAASETIKLITGKGKQVLYPKQIVIDPYNLDFKVRSVYTIGRLLNYVRERGIKK